jgi:hypothetical protein
MGERQYALVQQLGKGAFGVATLYRRCDVDLIIHSYLTGKGRFARCCQGI